MVSSRVKIGLLLAGHIVAGLLLLWNLHDLPYTAAVFRHLVIALRALVYAEAGLLGIWGALGTTRISWRIPVVVATTAYLCVVFITALRFWWALPVTVSLEIALPTVVVLLVLSRLRYGRRGLRLAQSVFLSPTAAVFQFTIRHLLMTTAAVAVGLAVGRGLRALTITEWAYQWLGLALQISCVSLIELTTLWAALGTGRPTPRLAMVVPTAFVVGATIVYCQDRMGIFNWWIFISWSASTGLQAIITAASLLVMRSCGWRLVRGTTGEDRSVSP